MSEQGFKRFFRLMLFVEIVASLTLTRLVPVGSWVAGLLVVCAVFAAGGFVTILVGRRRPGHRHDTWWQALT